MSEVHLIALKNMYIQSGKFSQPISVSATM